MFEGSFPVNIQLTPIGNLRTWVKLRSGSTSRTIGLSRTISNSSFHSVYETAKIEEM